MRREYVPLFFESVSKLLKKDGLFALQGITYNDHNFDEYKNSVDFIKKYIFPGHFLNWMFFFSSAFINMWEFYFQYCEAGFLERNIGDYQVIFAKSNARDINIRY